MQTITRPDEFHLLVVDDMEPCRAHLRAVLEPVGYHVHQAESGENALELLECQFIHLLLCDMNMHKLSGLQTVKLAQQIRDPMPSILISAEVNDRLIRDALQAKVFSVLSKPVDQHELLYTTHRVLGRVYGKPMTSA